MVPDKTAMRQRYAARLNERLNALNYPIGRGRAPRLAREFGVTVPAARKWLLGSSLPELAQQMIIEERLGMTRGNQASARARVGIGASTDDLPANFIRIPQLDGAISAGAGAQVSDSQEVVRYLDVAQWWASKHLPRDTTRIKIMAVRGDSMEPEIKADDLLFIDTSITAFAGDGIYVFNWHGHALVKRLAMDVRGGRLKIFSSNPAYQPDFVTADEASELHISGRVAAWWTLRTY